MRMGVSCSTSSLGAEPGRNCLPGPWAILMKENLGRLEVMTLQGRVSPALLYVWGDQTPPGSPVHCIAHWGAPRLWAHVLRFES